MPTKLFILPKKVNLQLFKNNLLAAVEEKSADKTEAVEGPKNFGSPYLPSFRRPCKNDTKVLKGNKSQKMSCVQNIFHKIGYFKFIPLSQGLLWAAFKGYILDK